MKHCALFVCTLLLACTFARAEDKQDEAGFEQLYNGKDLTGWRATTTTISSMARPPPATGATPPMATSWS